MAFSELSFYSKALKTQVSVSVILPEAGKKESAPGAPGGSYQTIYLLHGLSGNHTDWMRQSCIERYVSQYGLAAVMPEVGRSWYTDTAGEAAYFTFVARELPAVCRSYFRGMSEKREDNFVGGLSMGGYGAMKAALLCPDVFSGCISLSGSLDITRKRTKPLSLNEWRAIFDFDLQSPLELEGGENDLFARAEKNSRENIPFPCIYMWAGLDDTQLLPNRDFHALLTSLNVPHRYDESEGNHSWKWWDLHIQDGLSYLHECGLIR